MPFQFQPTCIKDQPIYSTISRFLNDLHRQEGRNISHVTVTVHGSPSHFVPGRDIHQLEVTRTKGYNTLAYQEMTLESPVNNMVMMIAHSPEPIR
ncbi:hypothetical protein WJU16_14385 [Chitinophaga pollutisoli]|uniref:Uncharacterized protein n=1 Tax=Chitinophaga pollutisoli TaxID=3133966 RepID=A0ABZ2YHE3_9BACT